MSVSSVQVRVKYTAGGGVTHFAVPWMFHYADALLVVLRLISDGSETVKAITTDYTVTGVDSPTGGEVIFGTAPVAGYEVHIIHDPDLLQRVVLAPGAAVPVVSVERQMDDEVHQNQRTRDLVTRGIYLADTDTDGSGAFDARSNRIKNLDDPVAGKDAATKDYVLGQTIVSVVPAPGSLTNSMWNPTDLLALTNGKGLTTAEMQVETDPYPGAVLSASANLREAFERIQYQLLNVLNWLDAGPRTHAYDDVPASNLPAVVAAQIAAALGAAGAGTSVLQNGSQLISQRFPSEIATGTVLHDTDAFVNDRWFVWPVGGAASITWNRTAGLPTGAKSVLGLELVGAAGITGVRYGIRLSRRQCQALGFGVGTRSMTFGAKFKNTGLAAITPTLTVRSTAVAADTDLGKFNDGVMTVRSGPTALGAAIGAGASASYTATLDFGVAMNAAAANGVEIYIDFGAMNLATTKIVVTDLWLAVADISSTLLMDDFYDQLERCKRHYQKTFEYTTTPVQNGGLASALVTNTEVGAGGNAALLWEHRPPLMAGGSPGRLTTYNPSAANALVTSGANSAAVIGAFAPRPDRTVIDFTAAGAQEDWYVHAAVDAEWYK